MSNILSVPLSSVRDCPNPMRPVDRDSEKYLALVQSIINKGFVGAISATEIQDPETGETFYQAVDGSHRLQACRDAGLDSINIVIVNFDEVGQLELQLMANVHTIETKPAAYSRQLHKILELKPTLTSNELAASLGKSAAWLEGRLKINKIKDETILEAIDEGKIVLTNAMTLAALPEDEQPNFVDRAMTMSPQKFQPVVNERIKEIREAARQGRDTKKEGFTPVAFMRKISELKAEAETCSLGTTMLANKNITDPKAAYQLALKWVLHLDDDSVAIQKNEYDERQKIKEEKAAERKAKRAAEKAERLRREAEEAANVAAVAAETQTA